MPDLPMPTIISNNAVATRAPYVSFDPTAENPQDLPERTRVFSKAHPSGLRIDTIGKAAG